MAEVLPILSRLSKVFQTKNLPFDSVRPAVLRAKSALNSLCSSSEESDADWQHELDTYMETNSLTSANSDDFLQKFVRPFIETILKNLHERFPEDAVRVIAAAEVFDPSAVKPDNSSSPTYRYGRENISVLAEHYHLEPTLVLTEWKEFCTTLTHFKDTQDVLSSLLKQKELFPNLAHIAACLLVIPMHSADCERGFSTMGRIKTKLRSRLCNRSLNSLMFISIEGPDITDFEFSKVVQQWSRLRNRRLFQGVPTSSRRSMGCQTITVKD